MDSRELIKALDLIEEEKGIDKEIVFEAIEASLAQACKKNYGTSDNIHVEINRKTGDIKVYQRREVVEEEYDRFLEIELDEARKIDPHYEIGDFIDFEITPKNFGRISAQTAKQVVVQKIREAEREMIYNEFIEKEREIEKATVQRVERKNVIVKIGRYEAILPAKEQIPGETYAFDDQIVVYIVEVRQTTKGPQITVSRTHYELVKRLFEHEMPEVKDGTVEIKSIAREAGSRSKMAVYSNNPSVDPVGSCVGKNGARVNAVVNELKGEKIDIVPWDEDPKKFIASALNPAEVISVDILSEEEHSARVVVPDDQLSLAIGKEGQNVRLAAKLTGWKVDIKSKSNAEKLEDAETDIDDDIEENFEDNILETADDDFEESSANEASDEELQDEEN